MSQKQNCKSMIERSIEIAASGDVVTVDQLRRVLGEEGYFTSELTGPLLLKQLRQRMAAPTTIDQGLPLDP